MCGLSQPNDLLLSRREGPRGSNYITKFFKQINKLSIKYLTVLRSKISLHFNFHFQASIKSIGIAAFCFSFLVISVSNFFFHLAIFSSFYSSSFIQFIQSRWISFYFRVDYLYISLYIYLSFYISTVSIYLSYKCIFIYLSQQWKYPHESLPGEERPAVDRPGVD